MTIAFDSKAETNSAANPTTVDLVPVGTLRGVAVAITHPGSADIVTGVTAGGMGMTRVITKADTTGVPGRSYVYELGTSVPAGTLTISVARTEATTVIHVVPIGATGAKDLEAVYSTGIDVNQADPQVTLLYSGRTCMGICALYSSDNDLTSAVDLGTMTLVHDHDFGTEISKVSRQTTPGSSDFLIGYTAPSVNLALSAMAWSEVVDDTPPPTIPGSGSSSGPRSPSFLRQALQAVKDLPGLVKLLAVELPRFAQSVVTYERVARLPYGATVRPSGAVSRVSLITVTDTSVFTIANPGEPRESVELTLDISNASGGTMGAITWGDQYEMGTAFVNPGTGKHRLITFVRMPAGVWREVRRTLHDSD